MDFGFSIPTRGPLANKDNIGKIAKRGEELGYRYLCASDHIVIPKTIAPNYPYTQNGVPSFSGECLEQLTLLTWLAAVTKEVRLLASVMVVPHRNPVHTAKALATIDVLSGGRLVVGCGAGWMEEEFEAIGTPPFAERGRVTDEYLRVFRELWTSDDPSFDGEYVNFSDIIFEPKPVQKPFPPIWIGGESGRALRRTAELGDCWYPIGSNPRFPLNTVERFAAGVKRLAHHAEKAGRDPATIDLAFLAIWPDDVEPIDIAEGERFIFTGSAQDIAEDIARLGELGVNHILFNFQRQTLEETIAAMEHFAEEIRPLAAV